MNSAAIARMTGSAEVVADHSWPGTSTTALRLRATDGRHMILKGNTSTDSFQREHTALSRWAPALGPSAPQLLDADEDAQLLLMTAVAGRPLQSFTLTPRQERHAYGQAGALLARFHHTAPRTALPSFGPDRAAYIRSQMTDSTSPLTGTDLTVLDEALHLPETLPPQQAQPSHLDFTSRNILWDTEAGVIDLEASRYEAVGRDFLRITQRTLHHRPDLRTAFYQGYGREPDQAERELMRICTVTDAAAIVITATARGLHTFATEARHILTAAVRSWPDPAPGTALPHGRRPL
ncbi:aminoglycoside phosphotransferase family protein [Streptomyces lydicus]|uniref:aminoglycoside phosphotransferase family protein n=2 Tax=Streptomyces lydicus TaxID=47763 RepID=UPI0037AD8078